MSAWSMTHPFDAPPQWAMAGGAAADLEPLRTWDASAWAAARRSIQIHGIGPLLGARLPGTALWAGLPTTLQEELAEQYRLNGQRIALMQVQLDALAQAATAAGVALMTLKGAALINGYYADPALRPMADLDLLVQVEAADAVEAILQQLGYRLTEASLRHKAYDAGDGRVVLATGEHPDNPRGVEIHTHVAERLRGLQLEITTALWTDPQPLGTGGKVMERFAMRNDLENAPGNCYVPAPAALMLHLLLHTSHNLYNRRLRMIQLYDIALVARTLDEAGWSAALAPALVCKAGRLLYAPLALAERWYGPLASPAVRGALVAQTPLALQKLVTQATLTQLALCGGEVSIGHRLAWYHPGRERLGALWHSLLPEPRELRQLYPRLGGALPLAYVRHGAHLAGWAVRRAMGRPRPVG